MAASIDPNSGFCSQTYTFHSLRPPVHLPPPIAPISSVDFAFSLHSISPETTALINPTTGHHLSYSQFLHQIQTLSTSLRTQIGLSKGDTAFVLSSPSLQIPVLYFSLLSLGVIVSPSNPSNTKSEISRQIELSKPVIAFATSTTAHLLPSLRYPILLLDSSGFESMKRISIPTQAKLTRVVVTQSDPAAILYSSGTTGRVKGTVLTHRNFTAILAGIHSLGKRKEGAPPPVVLTMVPYFHIYGFVHCLKTIAMGETAVMLGRFDLRLMLKVVEEFRVTSIAVAPPVVVAMVKSDEVVAAYDLTSLETVFSGGAPLGKEVIARFTNLFPNVYLPQAYGLTETTGGIFRSTGLESCQPGTTGRLAANCEAKIIDPETSAALPPCKQGELWIKGPTVMKGYIGDEEANTAAFDSNGWLKTGDLCYIDNSGFLYVVDRIKELIKYKGYQVAPAELEQLLQSHPDIVDAAVIPYPNEETGQVPMAFVVRHPQSSLDEAQVMDFIAKQVSAYKKIRRVSFINAIPKNAPGKILRKELVKRALSSHDAKL